MRHTARAVVMSDVGFASSSRDRGSRRWELQDVTADEIWTIRLITAVAGIFRRNSCIGLDIANA